MVGPVLHSLHGLVYMNGLVRKREVAPAQGADLPDAQTGKETQQNSHIPSVQVRIEISAQFRLFTAAENPKIPCRLPCPDGGNVAADRISFPPPQGENPAQDGQVVLCQDLAQIKMRNFSSS